MNIAQHLPKANLVTIDNAVSITKITGWTITGHSLGGGLASAASLVSGFHADTFNAAGIHSATVPRFLNGAAPLGNANNITAYRTESDELTEMQEGNTVVGWGAANAAGTAYWLEDEAEDSKTDYQSEKWLGHSMLMVMQGLLVDRIGRQLNMNYIIDYTSNPEAENNRTAPLDTACYRGKNGINALGGYGLFYYYTDAGTTDIRTLYAE
jgi:hypothetical protein